jgi:formylglycine-generating enzyme required for sulfatase activity
MRRGGQHWRDGYRFTGGNDIDRVAWHDPKGGDHTQDVARKAPNLLGLYNMSGNVWSSARPRTSRTCGPSRKAAVRPPATGRTALRGGCFHNRAIHCTVSKGYQMERQSHAGCVGFRVVLAES